VKANLVVIEFERCYSLPPINKILLVKSYLIYTSMQTTKASLLDWKVDEQIELVSP